MNIKEAKQEIKNTLRAYHSKDARGAYRYPQIRQRPILLMGPPGIGKTAIMEQVARECGVGLVSYTLTHHTRQSAIGLPQIKTRIYEERERSVTEYTLSEIVAAVYECMEQTGKKEGILFIDEINCVSETLAPVMLQFLQNKTFGSHRIPEGWMIVAAGNPPEYNKSVREFDIVTLDRVRRMDITADCGVWMEYAWEREIHGAILAYLNLKKDHFYVIEREAEKLWFVTARGWEDLSELLKSYEELGVETTVHQIEQFLQHPEIARDFAGYYQLCKSYGEEYGIEEILAGTLSEEEYQRRTALGKTAGFDERFTVTGLLAEGLNEALATFAAADGRVCLLHQWLLQLKKDSKVRGEGSWLSGFIEEKKESLRVKEKMELISGGEAVVSREVLERLESYEITLKKEHIQDKAQGFGRIGELFETETLGRRGLLEAVRERLERAFAFVAASFGQEQEMLLLVSCLMRNRRAMEFISAHGCPAFFRYSEALLQTPSDEELQKACRTLD